MPGQLTLGFNFETALDRLRAARPKRCDKAEWLDLIDIVEAISSLELHPTRPGRVGTRKELSELTGIALRTLDRRLELAWLSGLLYTRQAYAGGNGPRVYCVNYGRIKEMAWDQTLDVGSEPGGETLDVHAKSVQTLDVVTHPDSSEAARAGREGIPPAGAAHPPPNEVERQLGNARCQVGSVAKLANPLHGSLNHGFMVIENKNHQTMVSLPEERAPVGEARCQVGKPPPNRQVVSEPVGNTRCQTSSPRKLAPAKKGEGRGGWGVNVDRELLASADAIEALWQIALDRGWLLETELLRLQFFRAARSIFRRSAPDYGGDNPIQEVGKLFTWTIKSRAWHLSNNADDEWAQAAIKRLERAARDAAGGYNPHG